MNTKPNIENYGVNNQYVHNLDPFFNLESNVGTSLLHANA
jgi:hypothetical protein